MSLKQVLKYITESKCIRRLENFWRGNFAKQATGQTEHWLLVLNENLSIVLWIFIELIFKDIQCLNTISALDIAMEKHQKRKRGSVLHTHMCAPQPGSHPGMVREWFATFFPKEKVTGLARPWHGSGTGLPSSALIFICKTTCFQQMSSNLLYGSV